VSVSTPGNSRRLERFEPVQHQRLGAVLVADRAFLGHQAPDRLGERDSGAHRLASNDEASGSRAHLANKPRDDFRYTPVDWT
jgi:hypothetical protein